MLRTVFATYFPEGALFIAFAIGRNLTLLLRRSALIIGDETSV